MQIITAQTPLGDIRRVVLSTTVIYCDECGQALSSSTEHLVHKDDLADFIAATVKLHVNPGRNPHTSPSSRFDGRNTVAVTRIEVYGFSAFLTKPYWWSNPSLEAGNGATMISLDEQLEVHDYSEFYPTKTEGRAIEKAIAEDRALRTGCFCHMICDYCGNTGVLQNPVGGKDYIKIEMKCAHCMSEMRRTADPIQRM